MIAAIRPTGGAASSTRPNQQSQMLQKERSLICIWKSTARTDDDLIQSLLSAVSSPSQQNPNDEKSFAGTVQIIDRWNAKTTVILIGRRAHQAALHLIGLPRQNSQHPWSNVSEHHRDWLCPRISCVDCRPNIGAVPTCRHCGEGRPRNLRESMQIWKNQTREFAEASGSNHGDAGVGGTSTGQAGASSGSADNSSSATIPLRMPDGPAPKRARLASAEGSAATANSADISSHPSADEAKARLTVWNCPDHLSDEQLVECVKSIAARANFTGDVSIVERFYAGKCIVVLTGANAHRASLALSTLPNGPQLTGPNQYPWRNIGEHHREWYCPRLSCVGSETDRPNIDESNGNNRASARCRGCGGPRPQSLLHAAQMWEQDLVDSLEEARQKAIGDTETEITDDAFLFDMLIDDYESSLSTNTAGVTDSTNSSAGSREVANPQNATASTTSAPNRSSVGERDSAAAGSARPVTPSNSSIAAPPSRKLTGSKAEFAIWNTARLAAGIDQPAASDGLLSSSKFFLNRTKDDLINLLPSLPHRRIWAFDTNPKNGAKGWIWTDCIDTFVGVYLQIDPKQRHAYEVIQQNVPCRIAFDLDMYTGDGVNSDKDDKRMAGAIIEETHRVIEKNWTNGGKPQFKDEVLVAHGPTKKSYHIIIKSYDADGKEVLLKDFTSCKLLANAVNDTLGDAILVDRKPGHGGKANPEPASFIDLAIYTKDRPFRLIFSSKITSPDRPFVDAMRRQFSFGDERDEKTTVMDTLIVPHNAAEMPTIEIKVADDVKELDATHNINLGQESPSTDREGGFASRIGGVVNSWLSWGSKKADQEEVFEAREQPPRGSKLSTTSEGAGPSAQYEEDEYPLLDFGKEVVARKSLGRDIPHPFKALIPWVEKLAADLPGAMKVGQAVRVANYEYSEKEAYVHFTLNRSYASYCHCIGRPHSEQNIMISIDLFDGIAYQRCWDTTCKDSETKGRAKHILSCQPPAGAMPTKQDLEVFDANGGLNLV